MSVTVATFLPLLWRIAPRLVAIEAMAPQLAVAGLVLIGSNLLFRSWGVLLLGIAAFGWNAVLVWPDMAWLQHRSAVSTEDGATLKVLSLNLWYANDDLDSTRRYLASSGADVIGLSEVTPRLKLGLASLAAIYPYETDCVGAEDPSCEIMLLSKHPLRNAHAGRIDGRFPYIAEAEMDWNHHPIGVAVTHLGWPFLEPENPVFAATGLPSAAIPQFPDVPRLSQSLQAANLAAYAAHLPADLVLMGDFNGASWTAAQKAFRIATGLENRGHLLLTWPSWAWPVFRLPIDHIFVHGRAQVVKIESGPDVGSDHLPVVAEIAILP